ncbi:glycoside hydrolase domain-containing protein, partial [Bacillus sp. SA1-12]|uniref:glycoside hydrolase domain-containing protein n=1 Tax=Bacillus sp. SA1-12 TaxID=1455638 RepID=UPI000625906C
MGKKLLSMMLIVLILLTTFGPIPLNFVSAMTNAPSQDTKTTNVALNAKATASGQCNEREKPAFAVDGSTETKWCDNSGATKRWLELDLGKEYNINQWIVQNACIGESKNCPFWNTHSFRLQMSKDGKTWEDIDVVTDNIQTIVDRYVPVFTARYVRLYLDKASTQDSIARIYEFELYGTEVDQTPAYPEVNKEPVDYVDPFINTLGDNGQTNPGPKTPFGLVALGPDSDGGAFSGYYYQDKHLKGFSHLRFSGAGCSGAGGNVLIMPQTGSFTNKSNEYKQKYDKKSEKASPGYYSVNLASGIQAELTASDNVGFHRYTFPASEQDGSILVDLSNSYAGMIDANLKVENNNEISGMFQAKNVCGHGYYKMYYSIQFDHDFDSYSSWKGDEVSTEAERTGPNTGVWVNFNTKDNKVIQAKVGLSTISVQQAKFERDHDVADWNFAKQQKKARNLWSELLGKVEITDDNEENKTIFYTQLYHAYLLPNNVTSSNGEFRAARDENTIRKASELGDDFEYYSGWATWDDFRKYSLFSILTPKNYENMVKSMVDIYKTRGSYVQWGQGYWPSPTVRNEFNGAVILDAYTKGFDDFDAFTALQGMAIDTNHYADTGVSGKLEKAYSAYYPMKLASLIGDKATYEKYREMALSYQHLWNPTQRDDQQNERGFFTPEGKRVASVSNINEFAYQGNLWHYRWFVPHDIKGLANLRGSSEELANDLEYFFEIDEYMAINEPDIQAPFLFNYLGKPYLTQKYAREYTTEVVTQKYHNHGLYAYPITSRVYRADPEGYLPSMDDDAGGMSSWFVFSAMGLFPGNPGDPYYTIGSPIFSEMTLHLDNGKSFTIKANDVSSENRYIQEANLNKETFDQAWISYEDIMKGGKLELQMGSTPNKEWGADPSKAPPVTDFTEEVEKLVDHKELITEQSAWKYFDKGAHPGKDWTSLEFDDNEWNSGKAMLGYGGDGVNTTVSYGPDANNKYPAAYFRKEFEVTDAKEIVGLMASLIRDDGAVVYLNGHEIIRSNMPDGEINYETYAAETVGAERDRLTFYIDPKYLVEGKNVLTAEVHQINGTSSDTAFELSLEGVQKLKVPDAPTKPVVNDKANTFGWTFVPGFTKASDYEYSTDAGENWLPVTANPQTVGAEQYAKGDVQVRVKADESENRPAGNVLISNKAYTYNKLWNVYELDGKINWEGNLKVDMTGSLTGNYKGSAVVVFQLLEGNKPFLTNAVPIQNGNFQVSQLFNVSGKHYKVKVYLVDQFNGNVNDSLWLTKPLELK